MLLKPIKNEEDYYIILLRVDEIMEFNPKLETKESDKLEILVVLIEQYEEKKWAISENGIFVINLRYLSRLKVNKQMESLI